MLLIPTYRLDVFTPPCSPGAVTFTAVAKLPVNIAPALPYLNATLSGAVYQPAAHALIWRQGRHTLAFHPREIAASNVEDRDGARRLIESMIQLVNETWERRAAITPDGTPHQPPTPVALYRWLPRTNCRQCGQQTCFNFALRLVTGEAAPEDCPPLAEPNQAQSRAALQDLLSGLSNAPGPAASPGR